MWSLFYQSAIWKQHFGLTVRDDWQTPVYTAASVWTPQLHIPQPIWTLPLAGLQSGWGPTGAAATLSLQWTAPRACLIMSWMLLQLKPVMCKSKGNTELGSRYRLTVCSRKRRLKVSPSTAGFRSERKQLHFHFPFAGEQPAILVLGPIFSFF